LTSKNPRKKTARSAKITQRQRANKKPREKKQSRAEHRSDAASERSEAQAGFRHMALTATRDDDDDPTKPRVVAYVAAENESNHKRFCFLVFSGPPTYFREGYFKRI
jgi:hypothetical protein